MEPEGSLSFSQELAAGGYFNQVGTFACLWFCYMFSLWNRTPCVKQRMVCSLTRVNIPSSQGCFLWPSSVWRS